MYHGTGASMSIAPSVYRIRRGSCNRNVGYSGPPADASRSAGDESNADGRDPNASRCEKTWGRSRLVVPMTNVTRTRTRMKRCRSRVGREAGTQAGTILARLDIVKRP